AKDFPRLWHASTTTAKDRKRMLRLLIEDITVEKRHGEKQAVLHVRWKGGACQAILVDLPPNIADRLRYPAEVVEQVRTLAQTLSDDPIATQLNQQGDRSATGKWFTASMIQWIRYRYQIPRAQCKHPEEMTVKQVAQRFGVSHPVVYYWIDRGVVKARRLCGSPYWITLNPSKERELEAWVQTSSRIATPTDSKRPL
ncbi:MAG: helix-turn-helix domain-containing protein, partial [Gammaproteobacteria bacterium]